MVARGVRDAEVVGSNPASPTSRDFVHMRLSLLIYYPFIRTSIADSMTGDFGYFFNELSSPPLDIVYTFVYQKMEDIMTTNSSIKRWGNSLAIRIPRSIIQDLALSENSSVQITNKGVVATIQPRKRKKVSLDKLVATITPDNIHKEVDWGKPVGREVW